LRSSVSSGGLWRCQVLATLRRRVRYNTVPSALSGVKLDTESHSWRSARKGPTGTKVPGVGINYLLIHFGRRPRPPPKHHKTSRLQWTALLSTEHELIGCEVPVCTECTKRPLLHRQLTTNILYESTINTNSIQKYLVVIRATYAPQRIPDSTILRHIYNRTCTSNQPGFPVLLYLLCLRS
jgi:hypothetical protein